MNIERALAEELYKVLSHPEDYPVRAFHELAKALVTNRDIQPEISVEINVEADEAIATLKKLQEQMTNIIARANELKGLFK